MSAPGKDARQRRSANGDLFLFPALLLLIGLIALLYSGNWIPGLGGPLGRVIGVLGLMVMVVDLAVVIIVFELLRRFLSFAEEAQPGLAWKIVIFMLLVLAGTSVGVKFLKAESARARAHEIDQVMQERKRVAAEASALDARRTKAERNTHAALIARWRVARSGAIDAWRKDLVAAHAVGARGVTPPMLDVQESGSMVVVTNRGTESACVLIKRISMSISGNTQRCTVGSPHCTQIAAGKALRLPTLIAGNPEICLHGKLEYRVGDIDHPGPAWWSESALDDGNSADPDTQFADRWSDELLRAEVERLEKQAHDRTRVER